MKYANLSAEEEKTVKDFFLSKHKISFSFWSDKKLLKRVHSVWVLSEKAAQALHWVQADSAGLLLLLEFKTPKPSKQGLAFLPKKA